jgi:hypothetical protein
MNMGWPSSPSDLTKIEEVTMTAKAQTKQIEDAFFNDYADIKKRLAEPLPASVISSRPAGKDGAKAEYVNVTQIKDLLDERAGIWEAIVLDTRQVGESICTVVRVTIHAKDGQYSQDGTGMEMLNGSGYGDPFSIAYAQAFRRACESHGLGRELWRKSEQHHGSIKPARGCTGSGPKATPALLEVLRRKVDEAGIDGVAFLGTHFPDCQRVEELTHTAVNFLLTELNKGRY